MLKIRLARGGRKKSPYYRILVTEVTSPRDSNFIEKIGTYNPLLAKDNDSRVTVKKDRAEYWISVGAQPSEKVAKFLIALGVKGAEKYKPKFEAKPKGSNLKKKALEKLEKELKAQAEEEAKAKAEEQKAQEEAAEAKAEEAASTEVVEETKAEEPVQNEEKPAEAKKEEEKPAEVEQTADSQPEAKEEKAEEDKKE